MTVTVIKGYLALITGTRKEGHDTEGVLAMKAQIRTKLLNSRQVTSVCVVSFLGATDLNMLLAYIYNLLAIVIDWISHNLDTIIKPDAIQVIYSVEDHHRWTNLLKIIIKVFLTSYEECLNGRKSDNHKEVLSTIRSILKARKANLCLWAEEVGFGVSDDNGDGADSEGDIEMGDAEMDGAEGGNAAFEEVEQVIRGPVQLPKPTQSPIKAPDITASLTIRTK
ncbi:hypothetical protein BDZ45DRAFT_747371 [Acephala macrosclerotiorum]|nr:hypothetical protein BDZ45DRAFT_747371 [Acephala macrosclerotiorum]